MATIENPTENPSERSALTGEGFKAGQLANATSAGAAVSRMAARFAAGDDALRGLVRERQDAAEHWRKLDGALVKAASQPPEKRDKAGEAAMRREMSALDERINGIDRRLATAFPEYAELTAPKPVSLAETQALLANDEALLTYLVWSDRSFIFVVRRDQALAKKVDLGSKELSEAVTALRKGLDPSNVGSLADIPPFDTTKAYELYQKLFQPVEHMLEGARHVFVVPDGPLQSLPLGVLVTKESQGNFTDFSGYRHTAWLARKYALTTLPSVSSLRALRTFAKRARASQPFLGIGDPQLEGETGSGRGVKLASLFTSRGIADVGLVRQLSSLPGSAGELQSLARTLGVGDEALILGSEATETRIKEVALQNYKVLAFATHGLVAGALEGLSEPALVLTPPAEGSERDDGLLTASEVAQLKLDADWVILSACNTAAADGTPGAEGLSGLAKAFFYAGSRALLVSHWPVASNAAVAITTRMLAEARNPGVGRSEAHRRAMLSLLEDKARPYFAHPLFWAPFVVVGEGGRAS
jgi:CHAT domain-containing protein